MFFRLAHSRRRGTQIFLDTIKRRHKRGLSWCREKARKTHRQSVQLQSCPENFRKPRIAVTENIVVVIDDNVLSYRRHQESREMLFLSSLRTRTCAHVSFLHVAFFRDDRLADKKDAKLIRQGVNMLNIACTSDMELAQARLVWSLAERVGQYWDMKVTMKFSLIFLIFCIFLLGAVTGLTDNTKMKDMDKKRDEELANRKARNATTTRSPIESNSDESAGDPAAKAAKP